MSHQNDPETHPRTKVPFPRFVGYFLWLGTVGFGGPIALAGHMQQDLVDERGWISKEDYLEGLALAQLAPGPLAAQLAIYLGYIRAGVLGGTAVGVAFVLPSFLMVLALSAAYVRFGGLPWMRGMFYGIGAAVIGIITRERQIAVGNLHDSGGLHGMDFARDHLAIPARRRSFCAGQGLSDAHATPERYPALVYIGNFRGKRHSVGNIPLFCESGNVRVRKRPGSRAISLRRSSAGTSLAN